MSIDKTHPKEPNEQDQRITWNSRPWPRRTVYHGWAWLRSRLRFALILYLLVLLLMTFLETWLVYPIPPIERADWVAAELEHEEVWFHADDGNRLHGWLVPHMAARRAIVYCHGNGEQVADNIEVVTRLRDQLQATVLIFDYRGYGHSEGTPNEAGLVADGLAAQKWLAKKLGLTTDKLVVMGRSIGGGVAVAMAAKQGARALVLESTFSRLVDVAASHYRWLPVRLLMRNRFDSLERIKNYQGPLFQSHGSADRVVPIELGRELYQEAPSKQKRLLEIPGGDHNDESSDAYYDALVRFLDEVDATPVASFGSEY
jgi:fermentation-respiration switch protein FrsA (DUF1100 family)